MVEGALELRSLLQKHVLGRSTVGCWSFLLNCQQKLLLRLCTFVQVHALHKTPFELSCIRSTLANASGCGAT